MAERFTRTGAATTPDVKEIWEEKAPWASGTGADAGTWIHSSYDHGSNSRFCLAGEEGADQSCCDPSPAPSNLQLPTLTEYLYTVQIHIVKLQTLS